MDLVAPLWGRGGAACMSFRHSAGAYLELMPCWLLMNPEGTLEGGTGWIPTLWVFCWSYRAGMRLHEVPCGSVNLELTGPTLGISCQEPSQPC